MKALVGIGVVALITTSGCKTKKKTDVNAGSTGSSATAAKTPKKDPAPPENTTIDPAWLGAYKALPKTMASKTNPITDAKVALGRMLYFETRISKNHDISCNSCHKLDAYGVDGEPTSPGHRKQRGSRNSPTVYNAAGHIAQFWDGRAKDVEEQAKGPILNPVEMAMKSDKAVIAVLKSIPGYAAPFKKAFPDAKAPITYDNVAKAIGAFERTLVTPSRWDKFLAGDKQALTKAEKAGFRAFTLSGCPTCHNGAYVGGGLYQKLGLVKPWPTQKDQGRFDMTKKDTDRMMFKVASLRNVKKTGPYFHDGQVADLSRAVAMMAEHQLGKKLDSKTVASIVTFLETLTGPLAAEMIKAPKLPPSGKTTPKPDPS